MKQNFSFSYYYCLFRKAIDNQKNKIKRNEKKDGEMCGDKGYAGKKKRKFLLSLLLHSTLVQTIFFGINIGPKPPVTRTGCYINIFQNLTFAGHSLSETHDSLIKFIHWSSIKVDCTYCLPQFITTELVR